MNLDNELIFLQEKLMVAQAQAMDLLTKYVFKLDSGEKLSVEDTEKLASTLQEVERYAIIRNEAITDEVKEQMKQMITNVLVEQVKKESLYDYRGRGAMQGIFL